MVEFGEKLKRAREEKGMTQQTLSDHLYVTRQAVSRWECGARYPDLLTAKKLSEVLEVSLDELLSGEEMKKCVEKNPIVESPVIGRVQSALYAFAGVAYLLMSILAIRFLMSEFAEANPQVIGYGISYLLGYMLITLLLFCGLAFSIRGKLTPKKTGVIAAAYFGMMVFSNIFEIAQTPNVWPVVLQSIIYLICIAVIVGYYFRTRRVSPIPVYCVAAFGMIRSGIMYFQMLQFENDFAFIVRTIWLMAIVGYMGLMVYQTYVLEKPADIDEILEVLGLVDRRHHLPNQLSGGQQQRVAIGRALITKPKLILADEPTGNLDSKSSQDVMDLLIQASRHYQQTILMITHNNNLAASVDRVFRVSDGILTDLGGKANETLS